MAVRNTLRSVKKGVIRRAATGLAKVGDTTARRTTRMTVEAVTALR